MSSQPVTTSVQSVSPGSLVVLRLVVSLETTIHLLSPLVSQSTTIRLHCTIIVQCVQSLLGRVYGLKLEQSKLRYIRPPQSQSGPNKFLKTSVCADELQHLHETNMINNFYTNSLRNFFWRTFLYFCCFLSFFISENLVFGFQKEKLSCNAVFKFLTVLNNLYRQNQQNLEILKKYIFLYIL